MFYSVIPNEIIMQSTKKSNIKCCSSSCGFIEYTEQNGIAKVERIISSNPMVYLNASMAPGAIIKRRTQI